MMLRKQLFLGSLRLSSYPTMGINWLSAVGSFIQLTEPNLRLPNPTNTPIGSAIVKFETIKAFLDSC